MSIAGIAKEVATISASALLFGDELTPLNITGVAVTVCGEFADPLYWCRFSAAPCLSPNFSKNIYHLSVYRDWLIHASQVS